jgi:hypothetical protein
MFPDARWPPPWQPGDVDLVLAALREVAAAPLSGVLPRLVDDPAPGWKEVAADPAPFLGLGLATKDWLERALPALLDASDSARLDGDSLVHCDVRSDNLCLREHRAVLLDWNHAGIGNPAFDIAFWLPSLVLEGGPEPGAFGVDDLAAIVAGFFAAQAGLPPPVGAPRVRGFQRAQRVALPWACSVPIRPGSGVRAVYDRLTIRTCSPASCAVCSLRFTLAGVHPSPPQASPSPTELTLADVDSSCRRRAISLVGPTARASRRCAAARRARHGGQRHDQAQPAAAHRRPPAAGARPASRRDAARLSRTSNRCRRGGGVDGWPCREARGRA